MPSSRSAILESLVIYTKLYGKSQSYNHISANLPIQNLAKNSTLFKNIEGETLLSRAAKNAGYHSSLIHKSIGSLIDLHLPCIAILSEENACIIEEFSSDRMRVKIIHNSQDIVEEWVEVESLEAQYLGYSVLLKTAYKYKDKKSAIKTHSGHWFKDTLKLSSVLYRDVLLASVLLNLFVLATPMFTMNVYDRVIPNNAKETLLVFTIGVILVYLIDLSLKYSRAYLLEIAAKKSDIIMSSIIFEKVLDLDLSAHPKSVGSFASNLKDFDSIRNFFTSASMSVLIDMPFAILFLLVIYYIGGSIVIIPIVSMSLILAYALLIRKPLADSIESSHAASALKNGILIESLQNIETIKTHNLHGNFQHHYEEATAQIAQKTLRSKMLSGSLPTVTSFFVQLNTVLVVFYGVYLIEDFQLSMGALIAVVILTSRVIAPLGQAASLITSYEDAKNSYNVIENILTQKFERDQRKEFLRKDEFEGKIEFKDVSFMYEQEGKKVLQNLSFCIEKGEKVGIIGRIGSGKSTIEKLILGLYEAKEGSILLDDIEVSQIDRVDLRDNIAYVPQDIALFKGTLRENILIKSPYSSDETLLRASVFSGIDEFVKTHPHAFDMQVGERGAGLSGGQRQSVGIARAFLNESNILLLDEPTNALDQLSEQRFIKRLDKEAQGKTMLLITQKMNLLSTVDRVIVMHDGKIFLDGKRDEVIKALQGDADVS